MSVRPGKLVRWTCSSFAVTLLLMGVPTDHARAAQTTMTPGPIGAPQPSSFPGHPAPLGDPLAPSGVPPKMVAAAARARNIERQHKLVADSDKLLELATQLHTEVARTDKDILSVDVVRRADEIERLAHNVKERMKGQQ